MLVYVLSLNYVIINVLIKTKIRKTKNNKESEKV